MVGGAVDLEDQGIALAHRLHVGYGHAGLEDELVQVAHGGVVIDEGVLPIAPAELVGVVARTVVVAVPGVVHASGQGVVACTAVQDVVARTTLQHVVSCVAIERVGSALAHQTIVAVAAVDDVGSVASIE